MGQGQPRQQREGHLPRPKQVFGTKHRKHQNVMQLSHVPSAHFQPRGDPTSWTSPSPPSWRCSYRRAWWSLVNIWRRWHPRACSPSRHEKWHFHTPTIILHEVRVWAQHCPTHPAEKELHIGARATIRHGQDMRSTLSKYYTVSNKEIKKKNQNRIHLHKIQIFELCINRRRFWLVFPKEALISFEMGKWVCYFAWGCIQKM